MGSFGDLLPENRQTDPSQTFRRCGCGWVSEERLLDGSDRLCRIRSGLERLCTVFGVEA